MHIAFQPMVFINFLRCAMSAAVYSECLLLIQLMVAGLPVGASLCNETETACPDALGRSKFTLACCRACMVFVVFASL
jgi:hypothetical protein